MATKGIYIYCVVKSISDPGQFLSLKSTGVYPIHFNDVAAIVSDMKKISFSNLDRKALAELLINHQKINEYLMEKGFSSIIPFRLGTIVNNKQEVSRIIENGYGLISDILEKIEVLTEIDIVATWSDFSKIIEKVSHYPDIQKLKENIREKGDNITQADQIEVGKLVKKKLDEMKSFFEIKILNTLSQISRDKKNHEVMNDQMVINAAFLINKDKKEHFDKAISLMDEEFNGELNFKIIGPLPCYSFYTLEIKTFGFKIIEEAKIELGLKEMTSEKEIKKAYKDKAKLFHPDKCEGKDNLGSYNRVCSAYQTLLEYSTSFKTTFKESRFSLKEEDVIKSLNLLKIRQ
ncbi:MAG: GvpL/GvpF family gas vesicle protein [Ignavibacteriaceae bacterium]